MPRRLVSRDGRPDRARWPLLLLAAGVLTVAGAACGSSGTSPAALARQHAFLAQVHDEVPAINQVRSDPGLVRLGSAVCSDFSSGVSFQALADRISLQDGNLPTSDLGTVITAAAEHLCPSYRSQVG